MLEDLRLKVFLAVARTGNFTRAGSLLGLGQSSVSQHIAALEKKLGVTLFIRSRTEVSLSPEGMTFLEYAERLEYWYDAALRMFPEEGDALSFPRKVTIAADSVTLSYLLPGAISLIRGVRKNLSFRVMDSSLSDGTAYDAVLGTRMVPESLDFEGEKNVIGTMDAVAVCSPLNTSLRGAAVSADGNVSGPVPFSSIAGIHVSNSLAVWDGYSGLLTPDLLPRVGVMSPSAETLKRVVLRSPDTAAILPLMSVRDELSKGELLRLPVSLPLFTFEVYFTPSSSFEGKSDCALLRSVLSDLLHDKCTALEYSFPGEGNSPSE